jgi:hypothetical protein
MTRLAIKSFGTVLGKMPRVEDVDFAELQS